MHLVKLKSVGKILCKISKEVLTIHLCVLTKFNVYGSIIMITVHTKLLVLFTTGWTCFLIYDS